MTDGGCTPRHAHVGSTGQVLSATDWLDVHFEACRTEYEAILRSVEIEQGWHVLDAGCGSGSYLPLFAELVGSEGSLAALDAAADNIAVVAQRIASWQLPCPVTVQTGLLTDLPYSDQLFDAVWCANALQYVSDEDLPRVLAEFKRVLRPGGLVAVKDVDMQLVRIFPADPFLVTHLCEASLRVHPPIIEARGSLRGRELRRWLESAGLADVWQRSTLIERWAPLRPVERQLWAEWLAFLAELAEQRDVPEADLAVWRTLRDPHAPDHLVDHPDFYACEGQIVAVGRVPAP
jgi:ubiquinone/menaquinone biosynthesis C-methylase UbiE